MDPIRKVLAGGALVAATLAGGALGASLVGTAGAQTPDSSSTSTTAPDSTRSPGDGHGGAPDWSQSGHQANGKTEELLTDGDKDKAQAAAEEAVPDATAQRVETDAEGAAYEVHMTHSDGSIVTVKLDSNFEVTDTIDGMG